MGTSVRGSQCVVAGDEITGSIDKIGTLKHKVDGCAPLRPRNRIVSATGDAQAGGQ